LYRGLSPSVYQMFRSELWMGPKVLQEHYAISKGYHDTVGH